MIIMLLLFGDSSLQVSLLQQSEATKLQAARLSAAQQLEAALKLQQQSAQQQLQQETQQLQDGWSERCRQAEAAAEKQQALRAHAESEVSLAAHCSDNAASVIRSMLPSCAASDLSSCTYAHAYNVVKAMLYVTGRTTQWLCMPHAHGVRSGYQTALQQARMQASYAIASASRSVNFFYRCWKAHASK
jgi:hypothetical protein